MATPTTYLITTAGAKRIQHNGFNCHSGRLVQMDATNPTTIAFVNRGWITTTGVAAQPLEDGVTPFTTYTVTAAGAGRINHNRSTANLAQGATLQLDALEDPAITFLARGWVQ